MFGVTRWWQIKLNVKPAWQGDRIQCRSERVRGYMGTEGDESRLGRSMAGSEAFSLISVREA